MTYFCVNQGHCEKRAELQARAWAHHASYCVLNREANDCLRANDGIARMLREQEAELAPMLSDLLAAEATADRVAENTAMLASWAIVPDWVIRRRQARMVRLDATIEKLREDIEKRKALHQLEAERHAPEGKLDYWTNRLAELKERIAHHLAEKSRLESLAPPCYFEECAGKPQD